MTATEKQTTTFSTSPSSTTLGMSTPTAKELDLEKAEVTSQSQDTPIAPRSDHNAADSSDDSSSDTSSHLEPMTQIRTQDTSRTRNARLQKTLSLIRTKDSQIDPGPPPDGGAKAILQAVLGHFIIFICWGSVNSFGVFQTYYTTALNESPSAISWIGSVQIFCLFFIGSISGRATDAGFLKITLWTGTVILLIGVFMTSLATEYWQVLLAQGVCQGLGAGMLFCPTIALVSTYFDKNRSVAIGFAASGSATGGLLYPGIVEAALPTLGFPWTMRIIGFINLVLLILCCTFLTPRLPPRKSGPFFETAAFREPSYTLYAIGMFFNFWGLYFAFYYIGSFATQVLGQDEKISINLLLYMNGIGFLGRMVPALLADRFFGPLNTMLPFSLVSSILLFAWTGIHSVSTLWVFATIFGLSAAGIQSLFPATLSSLTTDMKKVGIRVGMTFSIVAFAALSGPPLAGGLIQKGVKDGVGKVQGDGLDPTGAFRYAQCFAGGSMMLGFILLCSARVMKVGFEVKRV